VTHPAQDPFRLGGLTLRTFEFPGVILREQKKLEDVAAGKTAKFVDWHDHPPWTFTHLTRGELVLSNYASSSGAPEQGRGPTIPS
jgi:hypothetical protein